MKAAIKWGAVEWKEKLSGAGAVVCWWFGMKVVEFSRPEISQL